MRQKELPEPILESAPWRAEVKLPSPVLEIFIPSLPPREFSPNSRAHHLARHAAGIVACDEVIAGVLAAGYDAGVLDVPLVDIQWGVPDKRRRDWDNLIAACKPFIDGLVQAGVLRDDSIRDYQPSYGWFESLRKPRTEIKVYEVGR